MRILAIGTLILSGIVAVTAAVSPRRKYITLRQERGAA